MIRACNHLSVMLAFPRFCFFVCTSPFTIFSSSFSSPPSFYSSCLLYWFLVLIHPRGHLLPAGYTTQQRPLAYGNEEMPLAFEYMTLRLQDRSPDL